MSMGYSKIVTGALAALVLLVGILLANTVSYAGGAMILMPAEDRDVPEGSQIPDRRVYEIEEKVKAYKAKMRERSAQGLEGLPQTESPKPNGEQ